MKKTNPDMEVTPDRAKIIKDRLKWCYEDQHERKLVKVSKKEAPA